MYGRSTINALLKRGCEVGLGTGAWRVADSSRKVEGSFSLFSSSRTLMPKVAKFESANITPPANAFIYPWSFKERQNNYGIAASRKIIVLCDGTRNTESTSYVKDHHAARLTSASRPTISCINSFYTSRQSRPT